MHRAVLIAFFASIAALIVYACGGSKSCPDGATSCGGACVRTTMDRANCGKCGTTCAPNELCSQGTCVSMCSADMTVCNGMQPFCANVMSDNQHCGSCENACKTLETCIGGKCTGGCPQGEIGCIPEAGAPFCANVMTDNTNCGACNVKCGIQAVCAMGMCSSECVMGQKACAGDGGPPYCAKIDTDQGNCGGCGVTCDPLQVCAGGKCNDSCLMSQTKCVPDGGVDPDSGNYAFCTDTKTDNANCGACFNPCPPQQPLCSNGMCISPG